MSNSPATAIAKLLRGASWSTFAVLVNYGLNISTFIYLGRNFISPTQFGTVATSMFIMAIAGKIGELGLAPALIQLRSPRGSHFDSALWASLVVSFSLALLVSVSRTNVASFFNNIHLAGVLEASCGVLVLTSLGATHGTRLRRALQFKAIAVATIISQVIASIFCVVLGHAGCGEYSLVFRLLMAAGANSLLIIFMGGWLPRFRIDFNSLVDLWRFGAYCVGTNVFSHVATKMDEFSTAKFIGGSALGLYSAAYRFTMFPVALVKNQVVAVAFPVLAENSGKPSVVREIVQRLTTILGLFGFSMLLYIFSTSTDWILVLMGKEWQPVAHLMSLLCLVAMFEISIFPGAILLSHGKAEHYFRVCLFTKSLASLSLVVGALLWGVEGMVIGLLGAAVVSFPVYLYFSGQAIGQSVLHQLKAQLPPLTVAVSGCVAATVAGNGIGDLTLRLAVKSTVFLCAVVLGVVFVDRVSAGPSMSAVLTFKRVVNENVCQKEAA